jgi:hypothetical protein
MRRLLILSLSLVTFGLTGCEELPNLSPSAEFVYSPVAPVYAGETAVVFNAVGSLDSDGEIVTYVWDFGDGTGEQQSGGPTLSHTFPDTSARCLEITYTVLLTTIDDKGDGDTASKTIQVIERPVPGSTECK